jgi:predicted PurR-regulated permease PerM
MLTIVVLFLPLTLLLSLVINESIDLYQTVSQGSLIGKVQNVAGWLQNTTLQPYLESVRENWTAYAGSAAKTVSIFLFNNLKTFTGNSLRFIFQLFIMFYSMYFFFKDGTRFLKKLMHLSPLGDKYEEMLCQRFTSTTKATLKGTFIVGGIQGTLGGILFWLTGVEGALVWAIIMIALSIIPAIGSSPIWLPAGIIMLALGNIWQGLIILLVGLLLISTIDNLIRPILVGKNSQMHPLIVLFSTLGGIFIFGISGFIIGPVIAALFLSAISIYEHCFHAELDNN